MPTINPLNYCKVVFQGPNDSVRNWFLIHKWKARPGSSLSRLKKKKKCLWKRNLVEKKSHRCDQRRSHIANGGIIVIGSIVVIISVVLMLLGHLHHCDCKELTIVAIG